MTAQQIREYIRHPSDIPITVQNQSEHPQLNLQLNNVSLGGLAFDSPQKLFKGSIVKIKIDAVRPVFKVNAIVEWCEQVSNHFEVGVRFVDEEDAFRVRMVEQVCHINQYRKEAKEKQGRHLTKNKASQEWIEKHGSTFPNPVTTREKQEPEEA